MKFIRSIFSSKSTEYVDEAGRGVEIGSVASFVVVMVVGLRLVDKSSDRF